MRFKRETSLLLFAAGAAATSGGEHAEKRHYNVDDKVYLYHPNKQRVRQYVSRNKSKWRC